MVRIKRTWSDEDLIKAVKEADCLGSALDNLGLVRGGSYKSIKFHIERLNLDTSHFLSPTELLQRSRSKIKSKNKEDLFIENGEYNDYKKVKSIILRENLLDNKCAICGINEWNGQKLNLQMDHINGIKTDNRLINLRLLCPNCHSLTDNFCGKNRKSKNKETNHCIECNKEIHRNSIWCVSCKKKNTPTKIIWPLIDELVGLIQTLGYVGVGRKLGVSDNAVRKHIKKYGLVA